MRAPTLLTEILGKRLAQTGCYSFTTAHMVRNGRRTLQQNRCIISASDNNAIWSVTERTAQGMESRYENSTNLPAPQRTTDQCHHLDNEPLRSAPGNTQRICDVVIASLARVVTKQLMWLIGFLLLTFVGVEAFTASCVPVVIQKNIEHIRPWKRSPELLAGIGMILADIHTHLI